LLSNGQDISCTLRECLDPLKGLESAGQGPGNRTFQHQVRTLVSFHVWACQSVEDRDRFLESAHNRQVTVQAAVLRSKRHLMIQKIKEKSMSSKSQIAQEHVQDGAYVLTQDRFINQNQYDMLSLSENDQNECEGTNKTAGKINGIMMEGKRKEEGISEMGSLRRRQDGNSVGGRGGDVNGLNEMMIQDWRYRNERDSIEVGSVHKGKDMERGRDENENRDKDRDSGILRDIDKIRDGGNGTNIDSNRGTGRNSNRGMDIERVLRACQEAVQSNNASLQFINDAQTY
jgi:hypothetical protein